MVPHWGKLFRKTLSIARGSVADRKVFGGDVVEVVACPCRSDLKNMGFGAQNAIIKAAGPSLVRSIADLSRPRKDGSATLVSGGDLAKYVAVTITQLPDWADADEAQTLAWLTNMHANILSGVRDQGCHSLAIPTLCTGGMGVNPELVCAGVAAAMVQDFNDHPLDPLHVVIWCFDEKHAVLVEEEWKRTCVGLTVPQLFIDID